LTASRAARRIAGELRPLHRDAGSFVARGFETSLVRPVAVAAGRRERVRCCSVA
jgi:hypothetical protein